MDALLNQAYERMSDEGYTCIDLPYVVKLGYVCHATIEKNATTTTTTTTTKLLAVF